MGIHKLFYSLWLWFNHDPSYPSDEEYSERYYDEHRDEYDPPCPCIRSTSIGQNPYEQ